MSQSSFLDHAAQWTKEQCTQNLDEALPKLINKIRSSSTTPDILEPLKVFCQCFLPVCPVGRLENEVFAHVKDKIVATSHDLYRDLGEIVKETSDVVETMHLQLVTVLQSSIELIGYVDEFVCRLNSEDMSLQPGDIHSLPSMVLPVLLQSYTHCKESSLVYGEMLAVLTEQLSALFKRAHTLQMNFVSLFDKLSFTSASDQDVRDLCEVLQGLQDISVVAVSLDIKIMIVMWKTISRLACQHRDLLLRRLDVDPMLLSLATDMESSFTYMIQMLANVSQVDEKTFGKTTKVLGFQMKVLVTMVKEYESGLSHCVPAIVSLMLTIQTVLPPSVTSETMGQTQEAEIQKQLGIALEPLTSYLIPNGVFKQTLTKPYTDSAFTNWPGLCKILITVLKMLPNYSREVLMSWIKPERCREDEPKQPVLKALFNTVQHCYRELCLPSSLPSIMCKGKPQREVSLYHHLCSHICSFVASHPAENFSVLEECLLENVLSINVHNTLLATDTWCFVARYGTADLCFSHCKLLARLIQQSQGSQSAHYCHLVNAIKRLFKFLAPENQESFITQFPATSSLALYGVLPLSVFSTDHQQQLCTQLLSTCHTAVSAWNQTNTHRTSDAYRLVEVYRVLCNVCSSNLSADLSGVNYKTLVESSIRCMMSVPCTEAVQCTYVQQATAAVIEFLAYNTECMDNTTIHKILSQLSQWLKCDELAPIVKISTLYFLHSLGKHVFSPDAQQVLIMRDLPRMFSRLLADSNQLIHQVALENFARFAEETIHETIVADSLQSDERTQTSVVTYLNHLSNEHSPKMINYDILKKQQSMLEGQMQKAENPVSANTAKFQTVQPPNKRCRLTTTDEELERKCQEAVRMLQTGTEELQAVYAEIGHLPTSYYNQLAQIQTQLTHWLGKS